MLRPFHALISALAAALLGCCLVGCESLIDELSPKDQALLGQRRNLRQLNLNAADMTHAQLVNADMSESSMVGANFQGNDLSAAKAVGASFVEANLSHVNLGWSVLRGSDLGGANLYRCNLFQADLRGVNLDLANLTEAQLGNAHLMGTRLSKAKGIDQGLVQLAACWDARTEWPEGWAIPASERTCEKHGNSEFSRDSAVKSMKVVDESKLLLREEN